MEREDIIAELLRLVGLGYPVFPCLEKSKRPAIKGGLNAATLDPGQVRAWAAKFPGANWAIAVPDWSIVVDVDPLEDGTPNLWPREPEHAIELCKAGAIATTPKCGRHFWFGQSEQGRWRNTGSALAPQVDTRGPGGYVLIPPSRTLAGAYAWLEDYQLDKRPEELPAPPAWLAEALDGTRKAQARHQAGGQALPAVPVGVETLGQGVECFVNTSPKYQAKALALLVEHGATVTATEGDVVTFARPGKDPKDGTSGNWNSPHSRNRTHGFPRLTVFSSNWFPFIGGTSYSTFDVLQSLTPADRWGLEWQNMAAHYRALNDEAEGEGEAEDDQEGEPSQAEPAAPAEPEQETPPPAEPFPEILLERAPWFLREFVAYCQETAHKRQPVLALGAAITFQGFLSGRKIRDRSDSRTNVYAIGVAESGQGKEHARGVVKKILFQAGADKFFGETPASGASIVSAIAEDKRRLYLADEFGRILKAIAKPDASPHQYAIVTLLLRLYSSSNQVFAGDDYADRKKNVRINEPHVCLYGTTVPRSLFESFTSESVTDGFLARVCFFHGDNTVDRNRTRQDLPLPAYLVDHAKRWLLFQSGETLKNENPDPVLVPMTDDAEQHFEAVAEFVEAESRIAPRGYGPIWHRCIEKARRFALIYAAATGLPPEKIEIDAAAAEWAADLAVYLTRRLVADSCDHIGETTFENDQKKIEKFIREAGKTGRTSTEITRRFRHLHKRTREDALGTLVESCLVIAKDSPGAGPGRRSRVYVARGA